MQMINTVFPIILFLLFFKFNLHCIVTNINRFIHKLIKYKVWKQKAGLQSGEGRGKGGHNNLLGGGRIAHK